LRGQARADALKRAELSARSKAGYWKWQFEAARRKRLAAVEESEDARRAAKDARALRAEVARLEKLLADAGVASDRYGVMALRREVARLRKAAPGAEVQAAEIRRLQKVLWKERVDTAALRRLLDETVQLYAETGSFATSRTGACRCLSDDVGRLRYALQRSEAERNRLKVQLLRTAESARAMSPTAADVALRQAQARSRRWKAALGWLRKENVRLRRMVQAWRRRVGTQEVALAKQRATRAVLSKALRGRESVRRERARTGRPRGQRCGVPGPRPHAATRARGTHRGAPSAGRWAQMSVLREGLRGGGGGGVGPGRDRGPGPPAGDPPPAMATDLRVRLVADGGLGAPGAAAVRQHALRHQRLVAGPV